MQTSFTIDVTWDMRAASPTRGGPGKRLAGRVTLDGVRASAITSVLAALAGAGCDVVFGLADPAIADAGVMGDAADAPADAIDAPAVPATPACWLDPGYRQLGILPSGRYRAAASPQPWAGAQQTCLVDQAHLVVVSESDSEWQALVDPASQMPTAHWLGLTDQVMEGAWVAETGEPVRLGSGSTWGSLEPNNAGPAGEQCAAREGATITDLPCDYPRAVVCECERPVTCTDGAKGLRPIVTMGGEVDVAGARALCVAVGMRLAVLSSAAEQEEAIVVSRMYPGVVLWLDATDAIEEGDWLTSDGCRPYARWAYWTQTAREPNGGTGENCAAIMSGELVDYGCTNKAAVLCEAP